MFGLSAIAAVVLLLLAQFPMDLIKQWWQDPPSYVRFSGGVMLIVATIVLYRR